MVEGGRESGYFSMCARDLGVSILKKKKNEKVSVAQNILVCWCIISEGRVCEVEGGKGSNSEIHRTLCS